VNREGRVLSYTVEITCRVNGTVKFLTKGDNNSVDDRGLYAPGQLWLTKKDVVGRARGFLPYVGMVTIYMNEYPKFKVSERAKHTMHAFHCVSVQRLSKSLATAWLYKFWVPGSTNN